MMYEYDNGVGIHYYGTIQLLNNGYTYAIFLVLFNIHRDMILQKKEPIIPFSYKGIAYLAGVNRKIVKHHLKTLESIGVIKLNGKYLTVNYDYFMSVLTLYNLQKSNFGRKEVETAFRSHDTERLFTMFVKNQYEFE